MSRYRAIEPRVWTDSKFVSLSADGKMLWLYLLTAQHTLPIPGVIVAGPAALAEGLGWDVKRLRKGFDELLAKRFAIRFDFESRLVWLVNAIRLQPPANPNAVIGWSKFWMEVPECPLKEGIWDALDAVISVGEKRERFLERFPKPLPQPLGEWLTKGEGEPFPERSVPVPVLSDSDLSGSQSSESQSSESQSGGEVIRVLESLSELSGVDWVASKAKGRQSPRAIVAARIRDGLSGDELIRIAEFCAIGKGWRADEKMHEYLRPHTLWGADKYAKYLAPSKAWDGSVKRSGLQPRSAAQAIWDDAIALEAEGR